MIVLVSVAAAWAFNDARDSGLAWNWAPPPSAFPVIADFGQMKKALEDPNLFLVDARDEIFYKAGHLPGAVNWPVNEADQKMGEWVKTLDPSRRLIFYCSDATCRMAENLAAKLAPFNYVPAIYVPGFDGWEAEGGEVSTSPPEKGGAG